MQTSYKNNWILVNEEIIVPSTIQRSEDKSEKWYVEVRDVATSALKCFNWFTDLRTAVEWAQSRIDAMQVSA